MRSKPLHSTLSVFHMSYVLHYFVPTISPIPLRGLLVKAPIYVCIYPYSIQGPSQHHLTRYPRLKRIVYVYILEEDELHGNRGIAVYKDSMHQRVLVIYSYI